LDPFNSLPSCTWPQTANRGLTRHRVWRSTCSRQRHDLWTHHNGTWEGCVTTRSVSRESGPIIVKPAALSHSQRPTSLEQENMVIRRF
jgi:hypothetical protein